MFHYSFGCNADDRTNANISWGNEEKHFSSTDAVRACNHKYTLTSRSRVSRQICDSASRIVPWRHWLQPFSRKCANRCCSASQPEDPNQPIFSSATRCPWPQLAELFLLQNDPLPPRPHIHALQASWCLSVSYIPLWGIQVQCAR